MRKIIAILALTALALGAAYYVLSLPEVPPVKADITYSYKLSYILSAYGIEELDPLISEPPPSASLEGVPSISYAKQYCATTCLQMVTAYYGMNFSIHYLNFITGFTYGATLFNYGNETFFLPYSDPFMGLRNAADYLGLRYRFLVTDDEEAFVKAIKLFIASGTPVIVPVNAARLYSLEGFIPHFELVVGYEGDEFVLHEPMKHSPQAPTTVRFNASLIAKANEDIMKTYDLIWSFGLAVYEPGGEASKGYADALRNAGLLEKGFVFSTGNVTIATGSHAFEKLADAVERGKIGKEYLMVIMEMAKENREDNARFISSAFPCNIKTLGAATFLQKASRIYGEIVESLSSQGSDFEEIASMIREAARLEYVAGVLMIDASYSLTASRPA